MTLYEKIISIYPELNVDDIRQNSFANGTILLQNDSDGKGDYIAKWEHPTLAKPTDEQLGAA
jgi:hypothetical protein